MHLTKEEIKTAVFSIVFEADGEKRKSYPLSELKDVSDAFNLLNASSDDSGSYVDGEIDLGTSQKAIIIRALDRNWSPADGVHVLSLKSKLEK